MVGMCQEQSALFWQSLTWKFVLGPGLVKESICHTSPSLLQTFWGRRVGMRAASFWVLSFAFCVGACSPRGLAEDPLKTQNSKLAARADTPIRLRQLVDPLSVRFLRVRAIYSP
jgi:hypothetical protein